MLFLTSSGLPSARMAGGANDDGSMYSSSMATVFIFNLIVGAGALTIPHAFARVGVYLGTACLIWLGYLSYVSATFVAESMACANAMLLERAQAKDGLELGEKADAEETPEKE